MRETEIARTPRGVNGLGVEFATAGFDAIGDGVDVLGGPDVDREAQALDALPSLGAVVLIEAQTHVAGFERDEHGPAVPFDGPFHAKAHDVLVPRKALVNVFHGN